MEVWFSRVQDVAKACCLKSLRFQVSKGFQNKIVFFHREALRRLRRLRRLRLDGLRPERLPPLEWHRAQLARHGWQVCEVISELRWESQVKLYQHRPQIAKNSFLYFQYREQCNVCKKLNTKFIVVFFGVWVKLVVLNVEGMSEIYGITSTPQKLVVTLPHQP